MNSDKDVSKLKERIKELEEENSKLKREKEKIENWRLRKTL